MGREFCLFMCYGEHICAELWMVEGVAALNGGLCSRTVEGKIRSKTREQCKQAFFLIFFFFNNFQKIGRWISCASSF